MSGHLREMPETSWHHILLAKGVTGPAEIQELEKQTLPFVGV